MPIVGLHRIKVNVRYIRKEVSQERAIMGLPELLESNTGLRSAKERFHVLFGQAEHRSTVTLGIFISGAR